MTKIDLINILYVCYFVELIQICCKLFQIGLVFLFFFDFMHLEFYCRDLTLQKLNHLNFSVLVFIMQLTLKHKLFLYSRCVRPIAGYQ